MAQKFTKEQIDYFISEAYPLTIIADRYSGTYSGGRYLAFLDDYWNIADEIDGCDPDCKSFWRKFDGIVGRGLTPDEAIVNLMQELKKNNYRSDLFKEVLNHET